MSDRTRTVPEAIDLSAGRLAQAYQFLSDLVEAGRIPGAAILVARYGTPLPVQTFGRQYLARQSPLIATDTIFLTASVTKPVTVAAVMRLVEQGHLLLHEPVSATIPEFGNRGKEAITLHHLMTHTSGLPDMLPNNVALREQQAPLSDFIRHICWLDLDFPPGTNVQYQSCGTAMLGELVERVTGLTLPEFLKQEFFAPLGMVDTALGLQDLLPERIAQVNVGPEMKDTVWDWNKPYWRHFAAPWGGMFSTVSDMFRFCQMFLNQGRFDDTQIFSSATVQAMIRRQTEAMALLRPEAAQGQSWGLGWRLQPAQGWDLFRRFDLARFFWTRRSHRYRCLG